MDTFKLILVRHGETLENKLKIIQGHRDTVLSEKGMRQAQLLGAKLENELFTHVYCSDLNRAHHTCEIIMKQNKTSKVEINVDKRLRERSLGCLEGQPLSALRDHTKFDSKQSIPGYETKQELRRHAKSFFVELCANMRQLKERTKNDNLSKDSPPHPPLPPLSSSSSLPNAASLLLDRSSRDVAFDSEMNEKEKSGDVVVASEIEPYGTGSFCGSRDNDDVAAASVKADNSNGAGAGAVAGGAAAVADASDGRPVSAIIDAADPERFVASVLIVSHGGLLMELLTYFVRDLRCKLPGRAVKQIMPNAGLSRFIVGLTDDDDEEGVKVLKCLSLFEVDHLAIEGCHPLATSADFI